MFTLNASAYFNCAWRTAIQNCVVIQKREEKKEIEMEIVPESVQSQQDGVTKFAASHPLLVDFVKLFILRHGEPVLPPHLKHRHHHCPGRHLRHASYCRDSSSSSYTKRPFQLSPPPLLRLYFETLSSTVESDY